MIRKLSHEEISQKRQTLATVHSVARTPVSVLAHSIRSTYNVGSIFRTSDGILAEKLWLSGYSPTPAKKEVLKTALGATHSVPWEYCEDPRQVIAQLKLQGYTIVALEQAEQSVAYNQMPDLRFPVCLILGNEISGVPHELMEVCDLAVEIPQHGVKQSLNVAVAYGIVAFELRRLFEMSVHKGPGL